MSEALPDNPEQPQPAVPAGPVGPGGVVRVGVAGVPAGPGGSAAVWLEGVDARRASSASLIDALTVGRQLVAWLAARETRVLAELQADAAAVVAAAAVTPLTDRRRAAAIALARDGLSVEVGLVLRIPACYALTRLQHATTLLTRLPDTLNRLEAAQLLPGQVAALVDAITDIDDADTVTLIEHDVLIKAPHQTGTEFRRSLRRVTTWTTPTHHQYNKAPPDLPGGG